MFIDFREMEQYEAIRMLKKKQEELCLLRKNYL